MRLLAYCIMPNHWHLVLYPRKDGDLSKFVNWLTLTHTQRRHAAHRTIGHGHLYQGRYKSFLCEKDAHFLQFVRYVERNPLRANLVRRASDWRWGSLWRRTHGTPKHQALLHAWPVPEPERVCYAGRGASVGDGSGGAQTSRQPGIARWHRCVAATYHFKLCARGDHQAPGQAQKRFLTPFFLGRKKVPDTFFPRRRIFVCQHLRAAGKHNHNG
jgi:hypothetical protein